MEKRELLYEGKAKKVYATENPDVLMVDYKDDATAFNGLKKRTATKYTQHQKISVQFVKLWRRKAFRRILWRSFPHAKRL